jgi:ketosteroid isomerase-like protein
VATTWNVSDQLEKLKTLYDEWGRGDYSRSDIFDPDMKLEGFGMGEQIEADSYEGFVEVMRNWLGAWERPLAVHADEFTESGDRILAFVRWSGRGRSSGVEMESEGAHLWTFRHGLIVSFAVYRDRDEARAALEAS